MPDQLPYEICNRRQFDTQPCIPPNVHHYNHDSNLLHQHQPLSLRAGLSANAGARIMKNFVEQAKLLRDDPRLGLSDEDKKTFERVFKRLAELRVAQARMTIDIENIEHLFSLLDMDMEFGGNAATPAPSLRQYLIFLILRPLEM